MALTISSSFDAGNIRVVKQDGDSIDLEIIKDHMSDFYQWFYFRVAGAAGRAITLRITNCAASAYPNGWPDYKGVMSLDRGFIEIRKDGITKAMIIRGTKERLVPVLMTALAAGIGLIPLVLAADQPVVV